jgi:hypothetical protein
MIKTPESRLATPQDIPSFIQDAIKNSDNVLNIVDQREIGIVNRVKYAVMAVMGEAVHGLSVAGYEFWQGQDDWGWNTEQPNWKRPEVRIKKGDVYQRYDGRTSFQDVKEVQFRNTGAINFSSLHRLDSNDKGFVPETETRKGMYGMGLKLAILITVMKAKDRAYSLSIFRKSLKGVQSSNLDAAYEKLMASDSEDGSETYVVIQAKDAETGKYQRAYLYRKPLPNDPDGVVEIGLCIMALDDAKISKEDEDQVIIAINDPSPQVKQSLEAMPRSLLQMNPDYDDKRNIVRDESDRHFPSVKNKNVFSLTKATYGWEAPSDLITVEQIGTRHPDGSGSVYFRKQRLLVKDTPNIHLLFDYNIEIGKDSEADAKINRDGDSVLLSGRIADVISYSMRFVTYISQWELILSAFHKGEGVDKSSWPEFNPSNLTNFPDATLLAAKQAFERLYPTASLRFAFSSQDIQVWKRLHPDDTGDIPVLESGKMTELLTRAGCESISQNIRIQIREEFPYQERAPLSLRILPKEIAHQFLEGKSSSAETAQSIDQVLEYLRDQDPLGLQRAGQEFKIQTLRGKSGFVIDTKGIHVPTIINELSRIRDTFTRTDLEDMPDQVRQILQLMVIGGIHGIPIGLLLSAEELYVLKLTPSGDYLLCRGDVDMKTADKSGVTQCIFFHADRQLLSNLRKKFDALIQDHFPTMVKFLKKETDYESSDDLEQRIQALLDSGADALREDAQLPNTLRTLLFELKRSKSENQRVLTARNESIQSANPEINAKSQQLLDWPARSQPPTLSRSEYIYGRACGAVEIRPNHLINSKNILENEGIFLGGYDGSLSTTTSEQVPFFPLESYNRFISLDATGLRRDQSAESVRYVSNGHGFWYSYQIDKDRTFLDLPYQAVCTLEKDLILFGNTAVLPLDARTYEVIGIELPKSDTYDPQQDAQNLIVLYDFLNTQYSVTVKNAGDSRVKIPKGARIYLSKRKKDEISLKTEDVLLEDFPTYYNDLLHTTLQTGSLGTSDQKVLETLRDAKISRKEKIAGVSAFWARRRLYTNDYFPDSLEDLIRSGKGDCLWSEVGFLHLCRSVGIPCRTRTVYVGSAQQGRVHNMGGSLHSITEYLDDAGEWQYWDPPSGMIDQNYQQQLIEAMQTIKGLPFLPDAKILARDKTNPDVILPDDIRQIIDSVTASNGVQYPSEVGEAFSRLMLNGELPGGRELSRLLDLLQEEQEYAVHRHGPYDYLDREKVDQMPEWQRRIVLKRYREDIRRMKSPYQRLVSAIAARLSK